MSIHILMPAPFFDVNEKVIDFLLRDFSYVDNTRNPDKTARRAFEIKKYDEGKSGV